MNNERINELAKEIQDWDMRDGNIPQTLLNEYSKLWDKEMAEKDKEKEAKSKEMRNRRRRGRYLEKKTARDVGGRADGRVGKKDVASGMFHYETKSHKRTPKYIQAIMSQAVRLASKGKIPVAVIYDATLGDKYAIVNWKDWLELHGRK